MNAQERKQPRASPHRIYTVVDFPRGDIADLDEEDSAHGGEPSLSNISPVKRASSDRPKSPTRANSAPKEIAIELRLSTMNSGAVGTIEANPADPVPNFLNGPVSLLTKFDFMHMIQEGVRLAVSQASQNNRVKVVRNTHAHSMPDVAAMPQSSSSSMDQPRRTMKYILHQYKPKSFEALRRLCDVKEEDFICSICDAELEGGYSESSGKSGSLFWYSSDQKYIMKSITDEEEVFLNRISTSYVRYIASHPHSLLCKFMGMYKITTIVAAPSYMRGKQRASRVRSNVVRTTRFVIMNNIFGGLTGSDLIAKFDLKGTTEDRFVKQVSGHEVLKDINFQNRWISLPENLAECLNRVIQEDCDFLLRHGVMDYSLIVGVKETPPVDVEPLRRLSGPVSDALTEYMNSEQVKSKSSFQNRLSAAKSAAVKAAHSVQKFLNPSGNSPPRITHATSMMVEPADSAGESNMSSMPEIQEAIPEEQPVSDEQIVSISPVQATSEPSPAAHPTGPLNSVFSSFRGGVVGLDEARTHPVIYYIGIIDVLQQYTLKKKCAHFLKRFTIGCCHEIDTVAPNRYKARFVRYMSGKIKALDYEDIDKIVINSSETP